MGLESQNRADPTRTKAKHRSLYHRPSWTSGFPRCAGAAASVHWTSGSAYNCHHVQRDPSSALFASLATDLGQVGISAAELGSPHIHLQRRWRRQMHMLGLSSRSIQVNSSPSMEEDSVMQVGWMSPGDLVLTGTQVLWWLWTHFKYFMKAAKTSQCLKVFLSPRKLRVILSVCIHSLSTQVLWSM